MIDFRISLRKLSSAVFLAAVFLLGMPLGGEIPEPPGNFRETGRVEVTDKLDGAARNTAIVWSCLYMAAVLLILRRPKEAKAAVSGQPFVLLLILLAAISAFWSPYKVKVLIDTLQMFGAAMIALMAAIRYYRNWKELIAHVSFALGLNQIVNLLATFAFPGATIDPLGRWAGVTGSANYLGSLAFCGIWAAMASALASSARSRLAHLVFLLISAVTLFGSGSVTSIVSTFVAILALLYQLKGRDRLRFILRRLFVYGVLASLLATVAFVDLSEIPQYFGRESHLSGRTLIWALGLALIPEHPWIGHGYGIDTESLGVTHWVTSFHNGYLELAVKLGFLGLVLLIGLFVTFRHHMVSLRRRLTVNEAWAAPSIIIAMSVYNLAQVSFLGARQPTWLIPMVLFFSVALMSNLVRRNGRTVVHPYLNERFRHGELSQRSGPSTAGAWEPSR